MLLIFHCNNGYKYAPECYTYIAAFFVIEVPCVPFEQETEFVNIIYTNFLLQRPKPIFIQALTIPIKTRSSSGGLCNEIRHTFRVRYIMDCCMYTSRRAEYQDVGIHFRYMRITVLATRPTTQP